MALRPKRRVATLIAAFTLLGAGLSSAAEEQQKININTASAQELTNLRGIGEKTAQAIVEYRESHGGFKSLEELVEVRGIGEKLVASLRDQITVGSAANAAAPPKPKPGS